MSRQMENEDGLEFEIPLEEMEAVLLSCRVDNDVARG